MYKRILTVSHFDVFYCCSYTISSCLKLKFALSSGFLTEKLELLIKKQEAFLVIKIFLEKSYSQMQAAVRSCDQARLNLSC